MSGTLRVPFSLNFARLRLERYTLRTNDPHFRWESPSCGTPRVPMSLVLQASSRGKRGLGMLRDY